MLASMQRMPKLTMHLDSPWPASYNAMPSLPRISRATEIIPRVYISDLSFAENAASLSSLGITHILSAMREFVAIPSELPLRRIQIPVRDSPFDELAAHLPTSTAFIHEALRDPRARVLIHCQEGISRSPSVMAAFLIADLGWTPTQAVQYIKSKRRIAEPNIGFIGQLHEYAATIR